MNGEGDGSSFAHVGQTRQSAENDILYTTAEMLDGVMKDDDANDPMLDEYARKYRANK